MPKLDQGAVYLFHDGSNAYAYRLLGAHPEIRSGISGYRFVTFAPRAKSVSLVGDFNGWQAGSLPLKRTKEGLWSVFAPLGKYENYQYAIEGADGTVRFKSDPYAFHAQTRPEKASKTYDLSGYLWSDADWMAARAQSDPYHGPMNIYEVHLGSWQRRDGRFLSYLELADTLVPYVRDMGYTHVELMPVMEHPLDMSWGYQVTGYFAATSRFGTPHALMALIDAFHLAGIGVILDWVPAHFPKDDFGLRRFDGAPLYEPENERFAEHPGWGTLVFDYRRKEVQSFLLSSAMFWLDVFHADGLRVDAVSSMIYLDFERAPGTWQKNIHGGRENLEAIDLLRRLNTIAYRDFPGVLIMAEESTDFPMVTRPAYLGGLGFGFKWNMGWMNDTLSYLALDPIYRKYHHGKVTFSMMYAFCENFVLPLSHDEVVHGKKSLLDRMPGDYWQKFAGLRALFGYMMAHPGKKLLFMGGEFGQFIEWRFDDELDWLLLGYEMHRQMQAYTRTLNHFYKENPPLFEIDDGWDGFLWLNANDSDNSVLSGLRTAKNGETLLFVVNFTPVYHDRYDLGLPAGGTLYEKLNSDEPRFGGSGQGNPLPVKSRPTSYNGLPHTITISVPPLASVFFTFLPAPEQETADFALLAPFPLSDDVNSGATAPIV